MSSLQQRLKPLLSDVLPVAEEADGAITVRHHGTFASLRVVNIVEGLDMISLTQVIAWDLPLTRKVSDQVARQGRELNFGSVTVLDKDPGKRKTGDVMLRYNFPGAGLSDDALRTLILLVLDSGAQIRDELIG
ncbi:MULTISPECIES: hypothetical protein [Mycobacterium]|uniref:YbjN domain-containing protein n=1 Tax=Mycobacterium kiyosense TaxID=2871094 RepID=A0A9P3V186_9MYCO|nr:MULTISPECIES: hypothetical protein [Mycobacterium]BDB41684.1 hypothetical protein IWGMT90018_21300 [Mycobacterium kiyosense]BDE15020.1 hypothetical protein MKCMC460_38800 [Mycobacterium sp. 20KCMC460]GLB82522.1 hypothetical protein SRL2020028_17780 [Mycobacterium kiyosense]GLB87718.1 hypothetical protein SRL2020130_05350 [Mycobacterium kiyosense]GLB97536.1 hypothetical protein SRL2020226_43120 [Mycobacterium kiyosense]